MRLYRDVPVALDRLYKDRDYVRRTHGHDI